jgi:predicted dehydrogenase
MTPNSSPVRIALLGCGRISAAHIAAIQAQPQLARLIAVIDTDIARAQQTAVRTADGTVRAFATLAAALNVDEVQAVLICTPNEMHTAHTLQALAAGRHVLVEKPMAENAADARTMADAAAQAKLVLALGHTFRHSAAIRYLQDHMSEFGTLQSMEVSHCVFWDGPQAPWWASRNREQGLILSLFAPHALDFVDLVMGDAPLRVHAEATRHQTGWQGEDETMILLGYSGRRMATVHVSYNQRQIVDRKLLLFDGGVVRIEDGEWLYWNDELKIGTPPGPGPAQRRMGGRDLSACFQTQLAEFVRAVRGQQNRSVLHEAGWRQISIIDRVKQAAIASNPTLYGSLGIAPAIALHAFRLRKCRHCIYPALRLKHQRERTCIRKFLQRKIATQCCDLQVLLTQHIAAIR